MQRIFILTILFLALIKSDIINAQNKKALMVKEINYGESYAEKVYRTTMKNSPSGTHNVSSEELKIIKRTDTIKAVLGAQFGVEYELLSKKNELTDIEITWIFPSGMTDQKGNPIPELKYSTTKITNAYTYSNYTLEGENEVVKGTWTFIISKKGKELYRKNFFLI